MIDFTPNPIALQVGPLTIFWYGICYAVGLFAVYLVLVRLARERHLDSGLIADGMIIIAAAALVGGRAYHVIDQWALYKDDPIRVFLPPYSGLGVYGGILTGTLAGIGVIRWRRQSFWRWADVVAPSLFVMQAIGRLGNFFNQELYGPPTNLPWGIAIQCEHRIAAYLCPPGSDPSATLGQHFQPLFLYESLSGVAGFFVLVWIGRHWSHRLRSGDLLPIFLIWYSITRFLLEFLRADNWTFLSIPTAQLVAALTIAIAVAVLIARHSGPGPSAAEVDDAAREAAEAAGDEDDEDWDNEDRDDEDDDGGPADEDDPAGEPADLPADEPAHLPADEPDRGATTGEPGSTGVDRGNGSGADPLGPEDRAGQSVPTEPVAGPG